MPIMYYQLPENCARGARGTRRQSETERQIHTASISQWKKSQKHEVYSFSVQWPSSVRLQMPSQSFRPAILESNTFEHVSTCVCVHCAPPLAVPVKIHQQPTVDKFCCIMVVISGVLPLSLSSGRVSSISDTFYSLLSSTRQRHAWIFSEFIIIFYFFNFVFSIIPFWRLTPAYGEPLLHSGATNVTHRKYMIHFSCE